ncbi:NERD domain-containing protein [Streptomyces sp. NBC_01615]|uniref:nuclease-related domain-containing DEAD/DEAH box helicase n=1 Tax=Streptomyces sp. NBC_01615 TaxID=2975898 RepID=UPI003865DB10
MRIIPSEISGKTRSTAERSVFEALKALPEDMGVALHSVHLPRHRYKRVGEIDFVLITPDLLLFIEVKGGDIHHNGGEWQYVNRYGDVDTKKEGPFEQASSGMHALENEIGTAVGNLRDLGVAGGYLVITPGVDLPAMTTYSGPEYLGSTSYNGGRGLESAIRRASRYWTGKDRNRWARPPIPSILRKKILEAIRPDFDLVPNLRSRITDLEVRFERLTAEQFVRIDELERNRRLIWTGGAGTGKTFLAAEAARRKSARGDVLFTCASRTLAAHISHVLTRDTITVLPFDRLHELRGRVFDHLIVDEAQDLMTFDHLDRLEQVVDGGLGNGRWIFMLDENNQVLAPDAYDPDALKYLDELGVTYSALTQNCRNTAQIVKQVQLYTGADLGVATVGQGEPVRFQDVRSPADEAASLDTYLDGLIDEGLSPQDITLVSVTGNWEHTSARLSRRFTKIERYADTINAERSRNRLTWSSVRDFKGLENQVVCLIDLQPEALSGRLDAIYVAWTRARAQLWIACRPGTRRTLRDLGMDILKGKEQGA